jgi:beta-galactosidase
MLVDPAGYRFDVPDGMYEVELLFADMFRPTDKPAYQLADGKETIDVQDNVFHIDINGNRVEEAFSPGKDAGYFHAVRKRFVVPAEGKGIEVRLGKISGKSFLSGIKLRQLIG